MSEDNLRYAGLPTDRSFYMKEFVVECPKCKRDALTSVGPVGQQDGVLKCNHCMHSEKAADLIRYKLLVKRYCDHCGKEIDAVIPNQKEEIHEITIPCPHCGITRTYQPKNEKYKLGYPETGQATDPIFNLPLWLQADVRGNLFWAYNYEHLREIKAYVSSKLRERQSPTLTTMVEKLPHFIKDAKNRDAMIKVIERLERPGTRLR